MRVTSADGPVALMMVFAGAIGRFVSDHPTIKVLALSFLVVVGVVLMTSTLFALAGFINAVYANSFDDISIIPTFVLTPLIAMALWRVWHPRRQPTASHFGR